MFNDKVTDLLNHMDEAFASFDEAGVFGGPSLHFHHRALDAARGNDFPHFAEMTYAMLTSWGMHRMGSNGAKMTDYASFRASMERVAGLVAGLGNVTPERVTERDWSTVHEVFSELRVMRSSINLIANSKVMAHWLPSLIAPIDREYTLAFLGLRNNLNSANEWKRFRWVHEEFYYPVVAAEAFQRRLPNWLSPDGWHTSPLKIVDNLVIGLMKHRKQAPAEDLA